MEGTLRVRHTRFDLARGQRIEGLKMLTGGWIDG
jgi:hypothetical protein